MKEAPLFAEEMYGIEALHRLKDTLYNDEDPTQVYYRGNHYAGHARGRKLRSGTLPARHSQKTKLS